MSYCRWSSDNWRSDLYCYENCDGQWVIHIAGNRLQGEWPDELPFLPQDYGEMSEQEKKDYAKAWCEQHEKVMEAIRNLPRAPIDLPHAGETICCDTLEEFKEQLIYLRSVGYRFPDGVLENVDEEIQEQELKK